MRRLGKGITKKNTNIQSQSQGPSTRRGDQRAGTLGIEVCDVCNICFYSKTSLSVHKRIHWRDCIFDCPNCNKRFSSLINLRAHQKTHCFETAPTSNPSTNASKSPTRTSKSPTRTSKSPTRTSKTPIKTSKYPTRTSKSLTITSKFPTEKAKFHGQLTKSATKTTLLISKIKATSKINKTKIISNTIKNINNIMSPKKRVLLTEGEYRCKICNKVCIGKLGLGAHARMHKEPTKSKRSKTWIYVNEKDVKTKMAGTTMACLLCKQTFFDERGLTKHIREAHRGQDMSEIDNIKPEGAIPCDNCDMVFSNHKSLLLHTKSCSKEIDQEEDEDDEEEDEDENYDEPPKNSKRLELSKPPNLKCPFCGMKFINRQSLSNHSRIHKIKENEPNTNQHKKVIAIKSKIDTKKKLVKDLKRSAKVQRKNVPVKVQRKNEPVKASKKNEPVKVSKKNEPVISRKMNESLKATKKKDDLRAVKINKRVKVVTKNKQKMEMLPSSKSMKCHICDEKFTGGISLSNHIRSKHPGEPYPFKKEIVPKAKARKKKFPYECEDCLKGFPKISRYLFHKKYKTLCKVTTPVENSEECKKSVVLVEKLNDKLVLMVAGNEGISESENSTSPSEIMDTEVSGKNKDVQIVEEVIAPIQFAVANGKIKGDGLADDEVKGAEDLATGKVEGADGNLVNGKEKEGGKKKPDEEIPMEVEESNKIVIEKEFAEDCGETVESPIHMIKNASDLEIVTVEDSIDIVEVEIGDIVDKGSVQGTDDVIPLEAPMNDEEIVVPKIAPVINSNAPAAATLEKSSNDEVKEDSEKNAESVSNGGSPNKIAESEQVTNAKNVPKLTEDKTNLEKDGENPELKGIIDFINNDCSE